MKTSYIHYVLATLVAFFSGDDTASPGISNMIDAGPGDATVQDAQSVDAMVVDVDAEVFDAAPPPGGLDRCSGQSKARILPPHGDADSKVRSL